MKRIGVSIITVLFALNCDNPNEPSGVSSVSVSPSSVELNPGFSKQFNAVVRGAGNFNRNCEWSLNAPKGLFVAATLGTFTVTCTSIENPAKVGSATVTVTKGSWIAFWELNLSNYDIFLIKPDGSDLRQITTSLSQELQPSWSPDGSQIVFTKDGQLTIMNADGSNVRIITTGVLNAYPAWSPNDPKIAFQKIDSSNNANIFTVNTDGTDLTQLTFERCGSLCPHAPTWSPDGQNIAFVTSRDGNWEVYKMSVNGSGQTNITKTPNYTEVYPSWSRDGKTILFLSNENGPSDIYFVNADGTERRNITQSPSVVEGRATWSPKGDRLVLWIDGQIAVMNVDGTNLTVITNSIYPKGDPVWGP